MKSVKLMMLCVLGAFLFSGCASFEGKLLQPVQNFPPAADERPTANVELSFRQYLNDSPVSFFTETAEKALEKKCIKRLVESGLYRNVGTDISNPDLSIHVDLVDDGQGSKGMAVLTGLTFYLIPSSSTDTYKLKATIIDRRTGVDRIVELEDFVTQWQQIFLLPLLPFKMTPVVASGVQNTLFDHLAIKAVEGQAGGTRELKLVNNDIMQPSCAQNASFTQFVKPQLKISDHVTVNVDGLDVSDSILEKLSYEIKERFLGEGFIVNKDTIVDGVRNYVLNVHVKAFDVGNGVVRATFGFGAGKAILVYAVEYSNEAGEPIVSTEGKEQFTGMELSYHSEYGATTVLNGKDGATTILLKETAKSIFELTQA